MTSFELLRERSVKLVVKVLFLKALDSRLMIFIPFVLCFSLYKIFLIFFLL